MRIRTQNFLGILPIFLGLAAAIGFLIYTLVQRETTWGLEREAGAIALTAGEFLEPAVLEAYAAGDLTDEANAALMRPLHRILDRERVRRIAVFRPDSRDLLLDIGPEAQPESDRVEPFRTPLRQALQTDPSTARYLERTGGPLVMQGVAAVPDGDGAIRAAVAVEVDASDAAAVLDRVRRHILIGAGVTVLLGLLCVALVTAPVRQRLLDLTWVARRAGEGNYQPYRDRRAGAIREVSDLANTFNTLISILQGVLRRTRRNLLSVEQFRTREDLVRTHEELVWRPLREEEGPHRGLARPLGRVPAGALYDLFRAGDRLVGLLGRVDQADPLEAAVTAEAAVDFARHRLQERDPSAALDEIARLFHLAEATVTVWKDGREALDVYRWNPRSRVVELDHRGMEPGRLAPLHDLGGELGHRLSLYLETFASAAPAEGADELEHLLLHHDPQLAGVLLLFWSADTAREEETG